MNEQIFTSVFEFFGSYPVLSDVAVFLAWWLPYILFLIALVYEFFIHDKGGTLAALLRVYLPVVFVWPVAKLMKVTIDAPRPFVTMEDVTPLVTVTDQLGSFPSAHAAIFAALAVSVFFCRPKIGELFIVGAILVGVGRIATGVHWPIDVLAGWLIGICVALIAEHLFRAYWRSHAVTC
jgi:membrane-associated phospholipid phosphatase